MKYVYMVVTGQYSDYGVEAVFSTRARANDYVAIDDTGGLRIERVEMDPDNAKHVRAGRMLWRVLMRRDGFAVRVWTQGRCDRATTGDPKITKEFWDGAQEIKLSAIYCTVWATDEIHAVKIVNEIRTRMIADGKWPAEGEQP